MHDMSDVMLRLISYLCIYKILCASFFFFFLTKKHVRLLFLYTFMLYFNLYSNLNVLYILLNIKFFSETK